MPYTLAMFLLWAVLMLAVGFVIGWLLRSLAARVQLARMRKPPADESELERLRERLAGHDAVVAERDRLRMELADVRGSSAGALGFSGATRLPVTDLIPAIEDDPGATDVVPPELGSAGAEPDTPSEPSGTAETAAGPDLAGASELLGRSIELDDLTVIEGIGPKIAALCAGIGVTTWRALADTDDVQLRSMLDDAGSRYKVHDPTSWPEQARLLAEGRWQEFAAYVDELTGER